MNCQEIRELFSDYLDGRLKPAEATSVEAHLVACHDCRLEFGSLKKTVSLLGSLDEIEASPDFLGQVEKQIVKGRNFIRLWAWLFEPVRIKIPLEITALVLVSILAFHLYTTPEFSPHQSVLKPAEEVAAPKVLPPAESPKSASRPERSFRADKAETLPSATGEIARFKEAVPAKEPASEMKKASVEPQMQEISAEDIALAAQRVKALLEEIGGRLMNEEGIADSGRLLTVELPVSGRDEFLSRIKDDIGSRARREIRKEGALALGGRDQKNVAAESKPAPAKDEPKVTLQLRILPKK